LGVVDVPSLGILLGRPLVDGEAEETEEQDCDQDQDNDPHSRDAIISRIIRVDGIGLGNEGVRALSVLLSTDVRAVQGFSAYVHLSTLSHIIGISVVVNENSEELLEEQTTKNDVI
jgi:hypothetical protein